MNCGPGIGPTDQFGFAGMQLIEAASNLDGPSGFNVVGGVETFDELTEQLDALCLRQREDLVENGFQSLAHKTEDYRGLPAETIWHIGFRARTPTTPTTLGSHRKTGLEQPLRKNAP